METGTLQSIIKYIFFAVVLALLVYIIVYLNKVNYGGWSIGAKDNTLTFTSPNKQTVFVLDQTDNSLGINKHKIRSGDSLSFLKDNEFMAGVEPRVLRVGNVGIKDQSDNTDKDKKGIELADFANEKVVAYLTPTGIHLPTSKTVIKSVLEENGQPTLSVYDLASSREILKANSRQPLGTAPTPATASRFAQASYSIM